MGKGRFSPELGVKTRYKGYFSQWVEWHFPWILTIVVLLALGYGVRDYFRHVTLVFKREWMLYLLGMVPVLAWYMFRKDRDRHPALVYSRISALTSIRPGPSVYLRWAVPVLRLSTISLLIFIAAGPVVRHVHVEHDEEGIDIVIALDVSQSMENGDILPNRLEAAKDVVEAFIKKRPHDRIGLVVFGENAYPYCPLTLDHRVLIDLLRRVRLRTIDSGRATAIGDALGTALNLLRKSDSPSKVIILVTDGLNNAGMLSPVQAAEFAAKLNVKIYTILMGDPNYRPSLFGIPLGVRRKTVDPELLEEIAAKTGGAAYLATNRTALFSKFQKILDQMKRKSFSTKIVRDEDMGHRLLLPVFLLIGSELLLGWWLLRRLP